MKFIRSVFIAGSGLAVIGVANAADYGSYSTFTSALKSGYYNELFSGWSNGNPLSGSTASYTGTGNGTYDFTALGGAGVSGVGTNLYSITQAISTDANGISITFSFLNSATPVTAFGGDFYATDNAQNVANGTISLTFSDGHTASLTNQTASSFYGYTSTVALTSVTLTISNGAQYVTAGNLVEGAVQPAPEPTTMAILGIGSLLVARKRRKA